MFTSISPRLHFEFTYIPLLGSHGQLWGFSLFCLPLQETDFTPHELARPFVIFSDLVSLPFFARRALARLLACLCAPPASLPPAACSPPLPPWVLSLAGFLHSYLDEHIPEQSSLVQKFGLMQGSPALTPRPTTHSHTLFVQSSEVGAIVRSACPRQGKARRFFHRSDLQPPRGKNIVFTYRAYHLYSTVKCGTVQFSTI